MHQDASNKNSQYHGNASISANIKDSATHVNLLPIAITPTPGAGVMITQIPEAGVTITLTITAAQESV